MIDLRNYQPFLYLLGSFFVPLFAVLLADWLLSGRHYERRRGLPRAGAAGSRCSWPWLGGFVLYQWLSPGSELPQLVDAPRRPRPPARLAVGRLVAAELRCRLPARRSSQGSSFVIALLGNLSRDTVPGAPPQLGGGPFHGARALRRLRVPARIVARCAVADRETLLPALVRLGTPVRFVPGESTAAFSFSYDGDRRTMTVDALGDTWRPRDLPAAQLTMGTRRPALARRMAGGETLEALARRHRVSLDGQGLVRPARTGPLELDDDFDRDILRHVWVLKLADEEAEVLGDVTALGVREVVVTHGSRGSTVYCGGVAEHIPANALVRDPTGAGDAFATAYIVGRNAGFRPAGAARRATAVVASLLHT